MRRGRVIDPDNFVDLFDVASAEETCCGSREVFEELEAPCLAWIRKERAKGAGLESTRIAWLDTVENDDGEIIELEMPVTPLAYAVAHNLLRSAELLVSLGADPLWSYDLSSLGLRARPADLEMMADGSLECSWRGTLCLDFVRSAKEKALLAREAEARALPALRRSVTGPRL